MNKTQLFGECQLGESLAHDINGEDEKEVKDEWGRGDTLIFLSSCTIRNFQYFQAIVKI